MLNLSDHAVAAAQSLLASLEDGWSLERPAAGQFVRRRHGRCRGVKQRTVLLLALVGAVALADKK